ncbi:hypothetical protein P3W85_03590 [Cupriavidus basilensis]|uniref:Uncharacterized protein n=1 Tax=Cupriavidus basilensis TaxID=68895 RepID=A0ABT6AHG6_9BURK|nr:hypothetical protein [Cupriavidus basilensis]MDF3832039.1 hypothetical protein [Cupriavidus basilensis]
MISDLRQRVATAERDEAQQLRAIWRESSNVVAIRPGTRTPR